MSQHRRRPQAGPRPRKRVGVVLIPVTAAALAIAAGALIATRGLSGRSLDPVAEAAAQIPVSHSAALLEAERQHMIQLASASRTLSLVAAPRLASRPSPPPAPVPIASLVAAPPGGGGTAPAAPVVQMPAPSPGTAQAIAYRLLPSFGFNARSQFGCLNNIWERESGWNYMAQNASGAYGIPQALPGSKMGSAGPNWQTNPATQIKWGLGYIKSRYGSPCGAWAFWQGHSWY